MDGATCRPNLAPRARKRRLVSGWVGLICTLALFGLGVAYRLPPLQRTIVFLPAVIGGVGFLQARRSTCVARAREGTFEADDGSKTPMAEEDVTASRAVAAGILRDAALMGLGAVALSVGSAFIHGPRP